MKASMSFDEEAAVGPNALLLKDIVGARVKRERRAGQGEGEGICMGVAVFTFQVNHSTFIMLIMLMYIVS